MEKLIFSSGNFFYERDEMKYGEICSALFINRIVYEIALMFQRLFRRLLSRLP